MAMRTKFIYPIDIEDIRHMTKSGDCEVFEYPGGILLPPVHPGRTLARELEARGLTANAVALKLRVAANRLSGIIRGQRAISVETALRLSRFFGMGVAFWMNLQSHYDLACAEQAMGERINREVEAVEA
jgi:addiction module HigA family antidote